MFFLKNSNIFCFLNNRTEVRILRGIYLEPGMMKVESLDNVIKIPYG